MKKILGVTLLAMCASTSAYAMDDMSEGKMSMMVDKHMKMMDTNGDGMISKEEHAAGAEKMFMEADANHDGMVSKQEMMDMKMKEMKMMKEDMSKDDGMMKKDK